MQSSQTLSLRRQLAASGHDDHIIHCLSSMQVLIGHFGHDLRDGIAALRVESHIDIASLAVCRKGSGRLVVSNRLNA